jgi:hypothetical protein
MPLHPTPVQIVVNVRPTLSDTDVKISVFDHPLDQAAANTLYEALGEALERAESLSAALKKGDE